MDKVTWPRGSTGGAESSLDAVRGLLGQLTADLPNVGEGPLDIEELPAKTREVFVLILSHVRERPALVSSVDSHQRDLLVRLMAASSSKRVPLLSYQDSSAPRPLLAEFGWSVEGSILPKAFHLLGGSRLLKHKPATQAEIHAAAVKGIPYAVLFFLTKHATNLAEEEVASCLGVSTRTLRRQRDTPEKAMPPDLGSKTWLFAETLAKAEDVFGSREDAEHWMTEEAMGLDGARPIDLLRTSQGANLVSQFLERLKYGVYN